MPVRENQTCVLAAKSLKLAALMLKMLEHCSRALRHKISQQHVCVDIPALMGAGTKKTDDLEVPISG